MTVKPQCWNSKILWFYTESWDVGFYTEAARDEFTTNELQWSAVSYPVCQQWLWLSTKTKHHPANCKVFPLASLCCWNPGKTCFWILTLQQALQGWAGWARGSQGCRCFSALVFVCACLKQTAPHIFSGVTAMLWVQTLICCASSNDLNHFQGEGWLGGHWGHRSCASECQRAPGSAMGWGQSVCGCCVLGEMENLGPAWNRILWKSCFIPAWDQSRSLDWEPQAGF